MARIGTDEYVGGCMSDKKPCDFCEPINYDTVEMLCLFTVPGKKEKELRPVRVCKKHAKEIEEREE
jgi:hypothetical protein